MLILVSKYKEIHLLSYVWIEKNEGRVILYGADTYTIDTVPGNMGSVIRFFVVIYNKEER